MRPCGGCGANVETDILGKTVDCGPVSTLHQCRPESPCCGMTLHPEHDRTDYAACNQCGLVYSLAVVKRNNRADTRRGEER